MNLFVDITDGLAKVNSFSWGSTRRKQGQKQGVWRTSSLDLNLDHVITCSGNSDNLLSQLLLPSLQEASNYGSIEED